MLSVQDSLGVISELNQEQHGGNPCKFNIDIK